MTQSAMRLLEIITTGLGILRMQEWVRFKIVEVKLPMRIFKYMKTQRTILITREARLNWPGGGLSF